jgi:hypothetical protein
VSTNNRLRSQLAATTKRSLGLSGRNRGNPASVRLLLYFKFCRHGFPREAKAVPAQGEPAFPLGERLTDVNQEGDIRPSNKKNNLSVLPLAWMPQIASALNVISVSSQSVTRNVGHYVRTRPWQSVRRKVSKATLRFIEREAHDLR